MEDRLVSLKAAIDTLETVGYDFSNSELSETELAEVCEAVGDVRQDMINRISRMPSAQPELHYDEWCTDCKEYDQERHCCPRFNKVIRETVEEYKAEHPEPCEDAVSRKLMYELGATCMARRDENGELVALGSLDMLPSVQPEIIRCKDCKYSKLYIDEYSDHYYWCSVIEQRWLAANDYCSHAVKREGDDE